MKAVMLLLLLGSATFAQTGSPSGGSSSAALRTEIRASADQVGMTDDIAVTVFFRSPEKDITIWNVLEWGATAGLYLKVVDSAGHEVHNDFAPFLHPLPPDLTGKDALICLGGRVFAGFESRIAVKTLFPKPGTYKIYCLYSPPLSRHYFQGQTIWGKEDGPVESAPVSIVVK